MIITKDYLDEVTKKGASHEDLRDVFGIKLKGRNRNQLPKNWQNKLIGIEIDDKNLEILNNPLSRKEKKRKNDLENLERIRQYKKKLNITGELDHKLIRRILNRKPDKKLFKKTKKKASNAVSFYESKEWRMLRWDVLQKYGFACMVCGRTKKEHNIVIHVDHIKPISKHPALKLDIDNLQVFCDDCNMGKLNRDDTDFRPF